MDRVVRFEIPAKNFERARYFYYHVFGWDIKRIFLGKDEYLNARTVGVNERGLPNEPGTINGAIIKKTKVAAYPTVIVNVRSLDEALTKIKKHGGKILMRRRKIPFFGSYTRVKDSEGNVIGLWENI